MTNQALTLQHFDQATRPTDDLFTHVNGGWAATAQIPDDRSGWGAFYELRETSERLIREIIERCGVNAAEAYSKAMGGRPVTVLNDADAAGLAEQHYGAGRNRSGVVVLLTFGTGIGSAVIHNGMLLPNTEFGHIEVDGKEAEHRAASSVKELKDWGYRRWTKEVTKVLVAVENAIWPDLIIVGGGISRKSEKWIPLLKNRTPVVAAELLNTAGIVGAAMLHLQR